MQTDINRFKKEDSWNKGTIFKPITKKSNFDIEMGVMNNGS